MPIVPKKEQEGTAKLYAQVKTSTQADLELYLKMIEERDKNRVVDELLCYAMRVDKDFQKYKVEVMKKGDDKVE